MIQGLLLDMEQMSKEWLSVKRCSEVKILFRKTEPLKNLTHAKKVYLIGLELILKSWSIFIT